MVVKVDGDENNPQISFDKNSKFFKKIQIYAKVTENYL